MRPIVNGGDMDNPKQRPLGVLEALYLVEAARGLMLTARHFLVNFPRHVLRGQCQCQQPERPVGRHP